VNNANLGKMVDWLALIKIHDGLEEQNTERIVSYIQGDDLIQLSGWFSFDEISALAEYLRLQALQHPIEQHPPDRPLYEPPI
jgi:hypothetical protein